MEITMVKTKDYLPFLEGKRIYLREVRLSDVNETYYRWMNDPRVTQYLESRFYPNSLENLNEYVKNRQIDRSNIFLAISIKQDHKHIGNIKLGPIDWIHGFAEIGVIIGEKDQWGKGYASEALRLVVQHAFSELNLHKVTAGAYEPNQASIKAFQKAGFEIEGRRKQHFFYKSNYVDYVLLGIINSC
jgi:ribosomal-protein-alanine N-acetyltransferase